MSREWIRLQDQLIHAGEQTREAGQNANRLMNLADDLICRGGASEGAEESLDTLIEIRDRLDNQGLNLASALDRLERLVDLKDRTLAQTDDLAAATENLELISDVEDQVEKIGQSFKTMRHSITEILAFEPVFNRADAGPATAGRDGQPAAHERHGTAAGHSCDGRASRATVDRLGSIGSGDGSLAGRWSVGRVGSSQLSRPVGWRLGDAFGSCTVSRAKRSYEQLASRRVLCGCDGYKSVRVAKSASQPYAERRAAGA